MEADGGMCLWHYELSLEPEVAGVFSVDIACSLQVVVVHLFLLVPHVYYSHVVCREPLIIIYASVAERPESLLLPPVLTDLHGCLRGVVQVFLEFLKLFDVGQPEEVAGALDAHHKLGQGHEFLCVQLQRPCHAVDVGDLVEPL